MSHAFLHRVHMKLFFLHMHFSTSAHIRLVIVDR